MIIVEGPDGAGKTTLIERLKAELGVEVAPRVVSKDAEAMVDLAAWVDQNLDKGYQNLIFDRHRLISEPIYGPVLRSSQDLHFRDIRWLSQRMNRFYRIRPTLIYCLPPLNTVLHNVVGDEDNKVVEDRIESIYTAYVARIAIDLAMHKGHIIIWDYTRPETYPANWINNLDRNHKESLL